MKPFDVFLPVHLVFGAGKIREIGEISKQYGKKAFAVFDPFLKDGSVVKNIRADLKKEGIDMVEFYDVSPNPRYTAMDEGVKICKANACDFVISVGGGSAIDSAKAIAIAVIHGGSCWDYTVRYFEMDKVRKPTTKGLPHIVVPTTAGTGTEATYASVVNNPNLKLKCAILNPIAYPDYGIVDPELMISVPREVTALTGMDAFAHAFETYISNGANPWSEALSLRSIELFVEHIRTAVNEPKNLDARMGMAVSSTLAGAAICQAGLAMPHAIGQPVSALKDAPHGGTLAACIPQIIEWTIPFAQEKFAKVAEIFDPSISCLGEAEKARKLPESLHQLYKDLDIAPTFGKYGMKEEEIPTAVDLCFGGFQWDLGGHPKPISREDAAEMFRRCL
jgi:alcohol dehydrogenase class IV